MICVVGSGYTKAILTHKKKKKSEEIACFEMLDALFEVLEASPAAWKPVMEASGKRIFAILQFLIKKNF
jgi:hypothetical protein